MIEWPPTETKPTKYWLSTLPEQAGLDDLVRLAKIRWRIERDFEAMKNELGLDHDEGRGWLGFPPQKPLAFLRPARVPRSFQPRGASATS